MSGYYARNHLQNPTDFSEDLARLERCEAEAGRYFARATKEQQATYDRTMADLRGLQGPRYDRAREAAQREWKTSTAAARELLEATVRELMACGEVSEGLSFRWDELAVARAMLELAE